MSRWNPAFKRRRFFFSLICSFTGKRKILEKILFFENPTHVWMVSFAYRKTRPLQYAWFFFFLLPTTLPLYVPHDIIQSVRKELWHLCVSTFVPTDGHAHPYVFPSNGQKCTHQTDKGYTLSGSIVGYTVKRPSPVTDKMPNSTGMIRLLGAGRSRRFSVSKCTFDGDRFRNDTGRIPRFSRQFFATRPKVSALTPALRTIPPPSIAFRRSRKKNTTRTNCICLKSTDKITYVFPFVCTEIKRRLGMKAAETYDL